MGPGWYSFQRPSSLSFITGSRNSRTGRCRLSDAYMVKEKEVSLEVKVLMLNINKGHNEGLLSACKTLREYAEYVERVRKYVRNMELEEAVDQAITECIQEGILSEFLKKNRAEAKSVSIYEYDMEKHMRMERAEAREEGKREGMEQGIQEGRMKLLQEMVQKKSKKGQSVENIAQDLELTEEIVRELLKELDRMQYQ